MTLTRHEAQSRLVETLLEKIRDDPYPSTTQMSLVEQSMTPEMLPEYLEILLEKVQRDTVPSIPLLQRISRLAAQLS
jgi:hypothetical protein